MIKLHEVVPPLFFLDTNALKLKIKYFVELNVG